MTKANTYLGDAEYLFLRGKTLSDIATVIPVSIQTLSEWKKKHHWEEKRKKIRVQPLFIADRIMAMMEKVVGEIENAGGKITPEQADSLSKLSAIRKTLGSTDDFASMVIEVSDRLSKFAQNFIKNKDELAKFFDVLSAFFADVKENNYG